MELTPFQKAGYTPEDEFKVIDKIEGCILNYAGSKAILLRDDGTDRPSFIVYADGYTTVKFIWLSEIEKI